MLLSDRCHGINFYSKLLVQHLELVDIIDIKCPLANWRGGGQRGLAPPPTNIGKDVVISRSHTSKV